MDKISKATVLDDTFRTALAGDSKDFKESSSSLMFAFIASFDSDFPCTLSTI